MMRRTLLAVLLFAAPAIALAADPSAETKPKKDPRVCRAIPTIGSRIQRADECHLASEWEVLDAQRSGNARDLINGVVSRSGQGGNYRQSTGQPF